jgi:hypothetical protein
MPRLDVNFGGTDCQKLLKSYKAADMNVKEINDHEFWCDGFIYRFPSNGMGRPEMIRKIRY